MFFLPFSKNTHINSITNWQCIAPIFSLNFMNVNERKRMRKLQNNIINAKKREKERKKKEIF